MYFVSVLTDKDENNSRYSSEHHLSKEDHNATAATFRYYYNYCVVCDMHVLFCGKNRINVLTERYAQCFDIKFDNEIRRFFKRKVKVEVCLL